MRGSTGRVEFAENGRRKNVNITILEMSKDGFVDVRHSELSLNNKSLSRDFRCYFANELRFFSDLVWVLERKGQAGCTERICSNKAGDTKRSQGTDATSNNY